MRFDNRPTCVYHGDIAEHAVGQVVGPNLSGEWLVVDEATYFPEADLTRAWFRYATVEEVLASGRAGA